MEVNVSDRGSRATLPIVLGILAVATAIPAWVLPALGDTVVPVASSPESLVLGRAGVSPEQITSLRVVDWKSWFAAVRRDPAAPEAVRRSVSRADGRRWVREKGWRKVAARPAAVEGMLAVRDRAAGASARAAPTGSSAKA
mgnify:CR=1 FL=1